MSAIGPADDQYKRIPDQADVNVLKDMPLVLPPDKHADDENPQDFDRYQRMLQNQINQFKKNDKNNEEEVKAKKVTHAKRSKSNSKNSKAGCGSIVIRELSRLFARLYPKKRKIAWTEESAYLRNCVKWTFILHLFWWVLSLAFIGFGSFLANLLLAMVSYSLFLTLNLFVGIVYCAMILIFIILSIAYTFLGTWTSPSVIGFVSNILFLFIVLYYVPMALYAFQRTGGRHGSKDEDGKLPEDYFKEHQKNDKRKKSFAKEFSKKLHTIIFKNINLTEIKDKFQKLNLRPEDQCDKRQLQKAMAKAGVFFTNDEFDLYFKQIDHKDSKKMSVKEILANFDHLKKENLECFIKDKKKASLLTK